MIIFPAIDILGGKCVRLFKGDFAQKTIFSDSPAEVAKRWEREGGEFLHLVDLDGAKAGAPQNLAAVKDILSAVNIPCELGGGIRDMATIDEILSLGIGRVILGSVAISKPELVQEACGKYGDRIVVGIDARDGKVAVSGWLETAAVEATELARQMKSLGVKTIIYTDISRDGTLTGVNAAATGKLAQDSGLNVVASGGVTSTADILALKEYEKSGVVGVIAGRALYTGDLSLRDAIAATKY